MPAGRRLPGQREADRLVPLPLRRRVAARLVAQRCKPAQQRADIVRKRVRVMRIQKCRDRTVRRIRGYRFVRIGLIPR
jgi:hypothetical protein